MPNYTFNPTASGNVEVSQNGQRVATTTAQQAQMAYGYNPVLAPNIPTSVVPAPKSVIVATPALAEKDLAKKNEVTNSLMNAVQQNTQRQLSVSDMQQPMVQTGQNTIQSAQTNQTSQQPAQVPVSKTKEQILQLLNSGQTSMSIDEMRQVAGTDFTGITQQPDGTWKADESAIKRIDANNDYVPIPGDGTGDPTIDYITRERQKLDAEQQSAQVAYNNQINQLLNGTFPLTADQQAQVAGLQAQFAQLIQQQQLANENYTGAVTVLGIRGGRSQYAPELAHGEIKQAVDQGIAKIAELNIKATSAVAQLKQAFADNNYKLINSAYKSLTDAIKSKSETLDAMREDLSKKIQMDSERLQQQKMQLDIDTKYIDSIASSALSASLTAEGSLDLAEIQRIADENGIDANILYGAVVKQKQLQDEIVRDETRFASDMLTDEFQRESIKANTEQSKASTAKTYADIAKIQRELATSSLPSAGLVDAQGNKIKLTAAQASAIAGFDATIAAAKDAKALVDQTKSGPVTGRTLQGKKILGLQSENQIKLEQQLANIKANFMKALSGAAVSEQEVKRLSKFLPDITDQESVIKSKLETLVEESERGKNTLLDVLGAIDMSQSSTNSEDIYQAPDGTKYVKDADGLYYPQ